MLAGPFVSSSAGFFIYTNEKRNRKLESVGEGEQRQEKRRNPPPVPQEDGVEKDDISSLYEKQKSHHNRNPRTHARQSRPHPLSNDHKTLLMMTMILREIMGEKERGPFGSLYKRLTSSSPSSNLPWSLCQRQKKNSKIVNVSGKKKKVMMVMDRKVGGKKAVFKFPSKTANPPFPI